LSLKRSRQKNGFSAEQHRDPAGELAEVPTPAATTIHRPIAHRQIVEVLVDTPCYRQIGVTAHLRNGGKLEIAQQMAAPWAEWCIFPVFAFAGVTPLASPWALK
jgi:hypothetical protein